MKGCKLIALGAFVGLFQMSAYSQQDRHSSIWFENLVSINPAAAGGSPLDLNFFTGFRNQWPALSESPFRTTSASLNAKIKGDDFRSNGWFGVGAAFSNDVSGDGRYVVNDIRVPIAYHIKLDGNGNTLGLGLQPVLYQRSLSPSSLTWGNQWNGSSFDQGIASNEQLDQISKMVGNVGAGIQWGLQDQNKRIQAGISGNYLLNSNVSFVDEDILLRSFTGYFAGQFRQQNSNLGISPKALAFFQGGNRNIIVGTSLDYIIKEASSRTTFVSETILSFGAFYRVGDAAILNVSFETAGFKVGGAFDLNMSDLSTATRSVGGFELFLSYGLDLNSGRFIR
jgi:type IX secretion system PorP/SprF family membrane protein